jgi:hypothetical protein
MGLELGRCRDPLQSMKQTTVPQVDLGAFDRTLPDVFEPGLKLPDHEGLRQDVEIAPGRIGGDPQGGGDFGTVPELPVVIREHRPEATQHGWRNVEPELPEVAFQKGLK